MGAAIADGQAAAPPKSTCIIGIGILSGVGRRYVARKASGMVLGPPEASAVTDCLETRFEPRKSAQLTEPAIVDRESLA